MSGALSTRALAIALAALTAIACVGSVAAANEALPQLTPTAFVQLSRGAGVFNLAGPALGIVAPGAAGGTAELPDGLVIQGLNGGAVGWAVCKTRTACIAHHLNLWAKLVSLVGVHADPP